MKVKVQILIYCPISKLKFLETPCTTAVLLQIFSIFYSRVLTNILCPDIKWSFVWRDRVHLLTFVGEDHSTWYFEAENLRLRVALYHDLCMESLDIILCCILFLVPLVSSLKFAMAASLRIHNRLMNFFSFLEFQIEWMCKSFLLMVLY